MTNPKATEPFSRNLVRIGLVLAVLLLVAAGAAFYYASRVSDKARHADAEGKIQVAINAKS
jgi:iron uptake system component EfeO